MDANRREFLERLAVGTAMLSGFPLDLSAKERSGGLSQAQSGSWDLSWVDKLTGKYKAVFDSPEFDGGGGEFRANLWRSQYQEVLGGKPADTSAVIVLRAKAIFLAMQQRFWDKYSIGKDKKVTDPFTDGPTTK